MLGQHANICGTCGGHDGSTRAFNTCEAGGEWGWAVGKWSRRPQQSLTDTDTRNFSSREFNEANIIHKYLGLDV